MGKPTGFLEIERNPIGHRSPEQRIRDFEEFRTEHGDAERIAQGARCMDCGVPFCHSGYGCPIHNLIPEWNDLIFRGRWDEAYARLRLTNNFPEYTGRVCPAPCETACVLGINQPPVTIKDNEAAIADRAFRMGLMVPHPPAVRTGKRIAIVGSGPAGLSAADELNSVGHTVTVFERADRIGGLLMYGIPNMKLDKTVIERRNALMEDEGIVFRTGIQIGIDTPLEALLDEYDAVLLATGSTVPRDLPIPGREFSGVRFAMEFLTENTRRILSGEACTEGPLSANGKRVIVIGGGDTGNDCIGTSVRQGATSVRNFELLPKPAHERTEEFPWPMYPRVLRTDYGHEEAQQRYGFDPREWCTAATEFIAGENGAVSAVKTVQVSWKKEPGERPNFIPVPGTERLWEADLVLLAMGFLGPEQEMLKTTGIETDERSNIRADFGRFRTNRRNLYAAGDCRRGQSLVVWAIHEGRQAAKMIDADLMGTSRLRG